MAICVTGIADPFKLNLHNLFSIAVITYLCHVNEHVIYFQQFQIVFIILCSILTVSMVRAKYLSTEKEHGDANNQPFCFLQSKNNTLDSLYTVRTIKAVLSLHLIVFISAKHEVESQSYAAEVQISLQTIYILSEQNIYQIHGLVRNINSGLRSTTVSDICPN
jgi:hypothetical protein